MLSFRFPTWVYWTLAGAAAVGAAIFTFGYDLDQIEAPWRWRLLFTIWGGPLTLALAATLVTWMRRSGLG